MLPVKGIFNLADKVKIELNIDNNLNYLIRDYGCTLTQYYQMYNNIEKIYDYTLTREEFNPEKHGLVMLYIANEYILDIRTCAGKLSLENEGKKFRLVIFDIKTKNLCAWYNEYFRGDKK